MAILRLRYTYCTKEGISSYYTFVKIIYNTVALSYATIRFSAVDEVKGGERGGRRCVSTRASGSRAEQSSAAVIIQSELHRIDVKSNPNAYASPRLLLSWSPPVEARR